MADAATTITHEPLFDSARATRIMEEAGVDLILASRRANVAYLADAFAILYWNYPEVAHCLNIEDDGCEVPYYFAAIGRDPVVKPFAVAHANRTQVYKESWIKDVRPCCNQPGQVPAGARLTELITERKLDRGRIAVEMNDIPAGLMDELRQKLPHVTFVDARPLLWRMRAVKSPREVARQRQAYRIGESIYREVLASIARNPNQTVSDVRATQMAMATRAGCPPLHFGYVFPQGPGKVAWDYANVPSYTFARGDVVLLDLGLIWKGYTTDFGRNATLGKARPEVREVYDKTVRCREAIARTVRPGVRASEVVQAAAKTREQLGLPAVLAVGHSLGVECHEQPSLHVNDQTVLEEGMTLVIELVEGSKEFVFLLEDAGLVTADGWQTLTEMGTELVELDV